MWVHVVSQYHVYLVAEEFLEYYFKKARVKKIENQHMFDIHVWFYIFKKCRQLKRYAGREKYM